MIKKLYSILNESINRFIAYHSTDSIITNFSHKDIETKSSSSTRIDGIFFSNIPQKSWGNNIYKVEIISKNPAIFDMRTSHFDSLGIQEAFDAMLRGDTSYLIDDLINYGEIEEDKANRIVNKWQNTDLIILTNVNYAKHNIEYIVPDKYYNGNSAKIKILEKL
jgi:hypothetical protein